jgi:hypothetical protein
MYRFSFKQPFRPWSKPPEKRFGTFDHGHNLRENFLSLSTMVETSGKNDLGLSTMVETSGKFFWDFRPWSQPSGKFFETFDHGRNLQ